MGFSVGPQIPEAKAKWPGSSCVSFQHIQVPRPFRLVERTGRSTGVIEPLEAVLIVVAGLGAGTVNSIVGSGSLITFPTLVLLGFPPLVANVTNTVGMVSGSISGAVGYRRELAGQRSRALPLLAAGGAGGISGALLLFVLPAAAFRAIVPVLILGACFLVAVQPRLSAWVVARRRASGRPHGEVGWVLPVLVLITGIYGGYFGAAQGVILIAVLSTLVNDDLQRLNGLKNAITAIVNGVAAVLFLLVAPVDLSAAILVAVGSTIGGLAGARIGRRLSPTVLRGIIVVVGVAVATRLLVG